MTIHNSSYDDIESVASMSLSQYQEAMLVNLVVDQEMKCLNNTHKSPVKCVQCLAAKTLGSELNVKVGIYLFDPSHIFQEMSELEGILKQRSKFERVTVNVYIMTMSRVGELNSRVNNDILPVLSDGLSPIAKRVVDIHIYDSVAVPEPIIVMVSSSRVFTSLSKLVLGNIVIVLTSRGLSNRVNYKVISAGQVTSFRTSCKPQSRRAVSLPYGMGIL